MKKPSVYLSLETDSIESTKKKAIEKYKEDTGDETHMEYPNCELGIDEFNFDNGNISISGNIYETSLGKNLGYISLDFELEIDTVIEIIEHYRKKLGKLKTIFEASK